MILRRGAQKISSMAVCGRPSFLGGSFVECQAATGWPSVGPSFCPYPHGHKADVNVPKRLMCFPDGITITGCAIRF